MRVRGIVTVRARARDRVRPGGIMRMTGGVGVRLSARVTAEVRVRVTVRMRVRVRVRVSLRGDIDR